VTASEAIEDRRRECRPSSGPGGQGAQGREQVSPYRPRRPQPRPGRDVVLTRRRHLASVGILPPQLGQLFTTSQTAVLAVVAFETERTGACTLCLDALASISGTSRTTVRDTLRLAARAGLVTVEERRRRGRPSLTNIVRIVSTAWTAWLRLRGRARKFGHHAQPLYSRAGERVKPAQSGAHLGQGTAAAAGQKRLLSRAGVVSAGGVGTLPVLRNC
jgi:hypothetical protein